MSKSQHHKQVLQVQYIVRKQKKIQGIHRIISLRLIVFAEFGHACNTDKQEALCYILMSIVAGIIVPHALENDRYEILFYTCIVDPRQPKNQLGSKDDNKKQ